MNDTNMDTTTEAAVPAADTPEPDPGMEHTTEDETGTDDDQAADTEAQDESPNREAAKYRTKLRAAEAERDQLAARLEQLQRQEVERHAAAVLADPADVWVAGTNLTDLLGADGNIDTSKVKTALDGITEARPHWRKPARRTPTLDGQRSGASGNQLPNPTSWAAALHGTD